MTVLPSDFTEVSMTAKHSNVYYIYKIDGYEPVEKATGCKNNHGLDLFRYKGNVYEGRSGAKFITEAELISLDEKLSLNGGVDGFNKKIDEFIAKYGESPRYTRPDERKNEIFPPLPPDPIKENTVFAKDAYGKKHYFFRFDYEGIELFTLKNAKEYFRQVYVQCEGYMLGIDQHHRLENIKSWIEGLGEGGVKGEVERRFNESMANPHKWADPGFANILGRVDEAEAHNAPIREARELEYQQRGAEREAKRIAEEQAEKAKYDKAIKEAERKILNREEVRNDDVLGDKSLIMQLFREHDIAIPLKTQGWIINALYDIHYNERREEWSYQYYKKSRDSTVFSDYLPLLVSAVQTKQQFEEMTQNPCPLDGDTENDCADCAYTGDYHYQDGDCVQRGDDDYEDMEI
jgi:hypothetical protein